MSRVADTGTTTDLVTTIAIRQTLDTDTSVRGITAIRNMTATSIVRNGGKMIQSSQSQTQPIERMMRTKKTNGWRRKP